MKNLILLLSLLCIFTTGNISAQEEIISTPEWAKDLIIYEIAPKGFTSPNGPESGTFNSLKEKFPYLQELGVNGIWLTGNSLSHPSHFYNIWTQYACYDPNEIDPTLGTKQEFKDMIQAAHGHGIKVFLDVIAHGVMKDSRLTVDHPEWFKGGSWEMADFNWGDTIPELDEWWVNTWVNYVVDYGIDGYRLDLYGYRDDLWAEIKRRSFEAGREMVAFSESWEDIKAGAYDFSQRYMIVTGNGSSDKFRPIVKDMVGTIESKYGKEKDFTVFLTYENNRKIQYETKENSPNFYLTDDFSDEISYDTTHADGRADFHFKLKYEPELGIKEIRIIDPRENTWVYPKNNTNSILKYKQDGDWLELVVAITDGNRPDGFLGNIQISCHDKGWHGFQKNKNPYIVEGRRSLLGYSTLFAPAIPIFFAGEEFNCDYRPLPQLSPFLFGGEQPGEGTWLYGSWIDWEQLKKQEKRDMLSDVTRMIKIRKQYSDILNAREISKMPEIARVPVLNKVTRDTPIPYVRWNDKQAIIVVANQTEEVKEVLLGINPSEVFDWESCHEVQIENIWLEEKAFTQKTSKNGVLEIPVTIGPDKTYRGGIGVYLITRE